MSRALGNTVNEPVRGLSLLLNIDDVSGSLEPEGRIASSGFLSLLNTPAVDETGCPDSIGSSTLPPCSEELDDGDDDDEASFPTLVAGPPNNGIHCSCGTDRRPDTVSG